MALFVFLFQLHRATGGFEFLFKFLRFITGEVFHHHLGEIA